MNNDKEFKPDEYAMRFDELVQVKYWDTRIKMWYVQNVGDGGLTYSNQLTKMTDETKANYPDIFTPTVSPVAAPDEQKNTRQEAMKWWNVIHDAVKSGLSNEYFVDRNWQSLTGREIETIWAAETEQPEPTNPYGENAEQYAAHLEMISVLQKHLGTSWYSVAQHDRLISNAMKEWGERQKKEVTIVTKPLSQLDIIHKGVNFSKRLNADNESYLSGAGYGYSCGYEQALKDASQRTPVSGIDTKQNEQDWANSQRV